MTVTIYPNGTGGVLGDELVTETELYTTGLIYFVHHTGDDANVGTARQKPWSSLVYALTVAGENDIVVMLDGHAETIDTPQTIGFAGMKVVGEGTASGVPTVTLTSGTDQEMLTLDDTNITLANIKFAARTATSALPRVQANGARSTLRGCYLECGEFDTYSVNCDADATGARFYNTTFVVTSTTAQPSVGLVFNGATNLEIEACTFDGGSVGFAQGGFFDGSVLGETAPANLRCQQLRLLNGAQFRTGDETTGYVGLSERSGSAYVTGFARRLANGFEQTGDAMLADTEFYMSGTPLYVHYGTGDDGNSGTDELAPKKTVGAALAVVSSDCDIIVLLPSHDETLISQIQPGFDGITIVGCGTSDGKPSCKLRRGTAIEGAPDTPILISAVCALRNIWFDTTTDLITAGDQIVLVNIDYAEIRGCLATPGEMDTIGVSSQGSFGTFRETKFESAGTAIAHRPARGLSFISEGSMTDEDVRGCEFSNAEFGFTQNAFQEDEAVARLYVIDMTQSYGADVNVNGSTTGIVNPETSSGSASLEW